jgi:hypothetical protein
MIFFGRDILMWVIDIRHWLDNTKTGPATPQLKFKVKKLSEIITYATAEAAGIPVENPPKCWRTPQRKPCTSNLDIRMDESTEQIYWKCDACYDEGVVTGWRGLFCDVSDHQERFC